MKERDLLLEEPQTEEAEEPLHEVRVATTPVYYPPEFRWTNDQERCARCKRCIHQCGWKALRWEGRVVADDSKCVGCHRCEAFCPERCITILPNPQAFKEHGLWSVGHRRNLWKQAETGGVLLAGMGNDLPYQVLWDHLVLDACQVTNPSIDPAREPMELRTHLGRKPEAVEVRQNGDGFELVTALEPGIELSTPIVFAAMSYGSISLPAQKSIAMAACELGTLWNTGEGGLHDEVRPFANRAIVQCASGRFGVDVDYLNSGAGVEIKIGQGAKPGIGGHLPGEKVSQDVSETRMIPVGSDALSPAPQHDIYSIEDLRQLIFAIKEATNYEKPVSVKIAAVHNVAAIASGMVRAGADILYLDGFRGGTGAAPTTIRDHFGIPIEIAIAVVDQRLRDEGIRNQASIIAAGGIRSSADVAKAITLGADAVAIGTAALMALGCTLCQKCYTGRCSWGITTQDPQLTRRLDPNVGAQRLVNLVKAWSEELEEMLGALGVNSIESLRGSRERLRGIQLDRTTLEVLGVKPAGVGA
ncbi:MAG: FMN-binding glutamate synthase family protein [Armatimonadetes bacterium]|nr:FMN-binding glutamate synthase family protein [Armatimonadota bacterium]NIM24753.1 FMN-binding glutamate synthase family protein [Armatimonadota bacterium]NIM68632.1 FMN-binding glutamate synthase family protein [Armatimonadota bacterium]NIM76948.1 FMN-binding glutamate synthase family protein [Armatimonadota bacterium]NIN06834.1 FMN-binding glutamate synthase family protein [Armatimonadota bacterium]